MQEVTTKRRTFKIEQHISGPFFFLKECTDVMTRKYRIFSHKYVFKPFLRVQMQFSDIVYKVI
jgi:hypothetical protein